jgi:hypothetical protein
MRKYLFIFLLPVVILRELGFINLNYYHSNMNRNLNTNWTTNSFNIHGFSRANRYSSGNGQIVEIPVRVEYRDEILYEDPSSGVTAVVRIGSLDEGFLWVPLFKRSDFDADASVSLEGLIVVYFGMASG